MHTLSLFASIASPSFMARLALVAGKGFDRMRLPHPVLPGSLLSGSLQVVEIRMGLRRADVHCLYEMMDHNDDMAMTMVAVLWLTAVTPSPTDVADALACDLVGAVAFVQFGAGPISVLSSR